MKKMLLVSALAIWMGAAHAQLYVGGAYGATQMSADCEGADACDRGDSGVKLYAGYQVSTAWAVEVGYLNFGKATMSVPFHGSTVDLQAKNTAVTVAVAGHSALNPVLHAVARLGVARVKSQVKASIPGYLKGPDSDTSAQPYLGLGLGYSFSKQLSGVAGADFTRGEIDGAKRNVRSLNLGVQYGY